MNRYPLWKYLVMIAAVLIGLFYTVPNIFPQVPAVQVSTNKTAVKLDASLLERVEKTLKSAGVAFASIDLEPENGVHVRFAKGDSDAQKKAKDLLVKELNPGSVDGSGSYIVALNAESTTPKWMQSLNAKPMALGLDLRGGVHFLMQVDMKGALDRAAERNTSEIRTLLREKKVQYNGLDRVGQTIVAKFSDATESEKANAALSSSNADLLMKTEGSGQDLRLVITLKEDAKRRLADSAIEQNQKVLGNRINALGLTEPIIQKQGADRIVIQIPGADDPGRVKDVIGRTGTLEIRLVEASSTRNQSALQSAINSGAPSGMELVTETNGSPVLVRKQAVITGERINGAEPGFDQQGNQPMVVVKTDSQGGRVLRDVTGQNVGNLMAILLIEKGKAEAISVAEIKGELGSNFQISGRMSTRDTSDLALLIRSGSIAAPMEIIEERTVGPSLGAENIDRGFNSVTWGFVALAAFICVYYALMGLISTLALSVNLLLLIAILSMLQATLTLPGIAAIALTLGMAIDANVLINERIREELRAGAKPQEAISSGFELAWATILDSNITTLIAGLALLMFGSGPVKGFAVVHCLGILTSMFSAVFFSRGIVNLVYGGKKKLEKISIGTIWRGGATPAAADVADDAATAATGVISTASAVKNDGK